MLERLNRKSFPKKTIIVLLLTGVLIDTMRPSVHESSETVRSSQPVMAMRQSSNETHTCPPCNTRSESSDTISFVGDTRSYVGESRSDNSDSRSISSDSRLIKSDSISVNTDSISVNSNIRSTNSDYRPIVDKLQSDMTGNFKIGYTENDLPLVKVYDYSSENETNENKMKRFHQIKDWLHTLPETRAKLIPQCKSSTKTILWFDIYHNGAGIRNKCRKVDFSICDCSCEVDFFIFNDTDKLYEPFGADAVLFQINKLITMEHPPIKHDNQVFVAVEREATPLVKIPLQKFEYIFNWTMSFRKDSDIFLPYGRILQRTGTPPVKDYSDIYRKKKKGIIWFVSHCRTKSKREDYARELGKYIDLDIVGECGSDICPRGSNDCLEKFEEEYYFLFNFENTYHTDYVTEKLFENFSKDMIQIVGGSAPYAKIAPDNTVIDVRDFASPEELATYLKHLMSSEERYTEYLKTKDNYYAESLTDQSQRAYCQLCSMLHDPDRYRNLYYSIGDWFLS